MTGRTTPAVEVTVDGQALGRPERLGAVRVASRLTQPAQCELVLALGNGEYSWPPEWRFGARLSVRLAGAGELFAGEVTAVETRHRPDGAGELRVRAYDLLHRLRKRQRPRVFEDLTAAEAVARLASDLPVELLADETGPRLDRVVQHRQSDFEFLAEVTAEAGLYVALRGRVLRLLTLAGYGPAVELRHGASLWDLRVEANLDRVARSVTALGWHSQRAEVLLRPATVARCAAGRLRLDPAAIGADGERMLVDRHVRSGEQLAALAQASLDASTHSGTTVEGIADGDPRLWAGQRVSVSGAAAQLVGECVLGEAVHTVDAAGYQTSFSTALPEPAVSGSPRAAVGVTLGRVTGVEDPEGLGRVRVALPAYGDLDLGWLAVLHPGAGPDRGLVILPDTGDTVAVALPQQALASGVVLGSLYGTLAPPDTGVTGGAIRRWSMRTPAGQSVIIDDAEQLVQVENHTGSRVELGPDRMCLHANTDLVIEAPGRQLTVRAAAVEFERAG